MSGLKEIRTRINSVSSTRKITSAMKMVSAAKFHKASEAVSRFEQYFQKTISVLEQVTSKINLSVLGTWTDNSRIVNNIAIIVLTSNSSMCGGFNQNVIKNTTHFIDDVLHKKYPQATITLYCLGKKGLDFFTKNKFNVHASSNSLIVNKPNYPDSINFAQNLINEYSNNTFELIFLSYNQYRNPAVQVPSIKQLLPIEINPQSSLDNSEQISEPSCEHIASVVIPNAIKGQVHRVLLENALGEHGARMTAMHQATDNATELIKELKLQYNKARQTAITKEILEIVAGAEALKG